MNRTYLEPLGEACGRRHGGGKERASRLYSSVYHKPGQHLGEFMRPHIYQEANIIKTKWTGYTPMKKDFSNLVQIAF